MLKIPEPTIKFNFEEANNFIRAKNSGRDLLSQCLKDPRTMPEDLSVIQVSQMKKTYKEMAWPLDTVLGQDSTTTIPCLSLYILCYSIQGKGIFDWSKIISAEISL
jgi:hypothetical protein